MNAVSSPVKRGYRRLSEIDEGHDELLARLEELQDAGKSDKEALTAMSDEVRIFISSVAEAGGNLYLERERSAAQSILNYWCNALTRANLEHLPSGLMPFSEDHPAPEGEMDFPFDLIGTNRRLTWNRYAAGRRLRREAETVWKRRPFVAIVGARGSGRATAIDEVILPAATEWMTKDGTPPAIIDLPAEGGLMRLFQYVRERCGDAGGADRHPLVRLRDSASGPLLLVVRELNGILREMEEAHWDSALQAMLDWVEAGHGLLVSINYSHLRLLAGHGDFQRVALQHQVTTVYDSNEIREFIEIPASSSGIYFEEGLVELIIRNVQGQQGVLDLLNFSLERLWDVFIERGGRKLIRHSDYHLVGSGREAVDRAAEAAFLRLTEKMEVPERSIKAAFLSLVTPTIEGWQTHSIPRADLIRKVRYSKHVNAIVTEFEKVRLLKSIGATEKSKELIAFSHYALAGGWSRLQSWIEGAREIELPNLLLPRVARRWLRENETGDLLWRGELLRQVEARYAEKSKLERRFIEKSQQARRLRRYSYIIPIVSFVLMLAVAVYALISTGIGEAERRNAVEAARGRLTTQRAERLLESSDPAGALLWFREKAGESLAVQWQERLATALFGWAKRSRNQPGSEAGATPDWQRRREFLAAHSMPELVRLAVLGKGVANADGAAPNVALNGSAWKMEYSPDGSHAVIAVRNLGDDPGGLLLWDFEAAAPRVVVKGRSFERAAFLGVPGRGKLVATISAGKVGDERGQLDLWKWEDLLSADQAKAVATMEIEAFPLCLAVEEGDPDRPSAETLIAVGTGSGTADAESRVLLFQAAAKGKTGVGLTLRTDFAEFFEGRQGAPMVNAIQFSDNRQWLLSGAGDVNGELGEALLFHRAPEAGSFSAEPRVLKHDAPVANVDFCPDNTCFVTATGAQQRGPGEARLWKVPQNQKDVELTSNPLAHRARVVGARFSPDGRYLLTASQDHAARIWTASGVFISILEHDGWLFDATWSPDGRYVLTGSRDGFARVWDATTGLLAWPKLPHCGTVVMSRFSPDGQSMFTATLRELRVWQSRDEQNIPIPTLPQGTVSDAAFSSDGLLLAAGVKRTDRTELGEVVVSEATTGKERARLPVGGPVNKVAFSADGQWLVSGGSRRGGLGGIVRIWSTSDLQNERAPIVTAQPVLWVGFPGGKKADRLVALIHNNSDNWSQVVVIRPEDGSHVCPPFEPQGGASLGGSGYDSEHTISAIALSPDGRFLAMGGGNLTKKKRFLIIYDLSSATAEKSPLGWAIEAKTHKFLEPITALAFDPSSNRLIAGSVDDWVRIFDLSSLKVETTGDQATASGSIACLGERKQNADISSVGFSADGGRAFSCGYDGRVLVFATVSDAAKNLLEREVQLFEVSGAARSAAFSRDATLIATGGDDRNVRLWHVESGSLVGLFPLDWPLATVHIASNAQEDEHLLTTSYYYTQQLISRGAQRVGPPDSGSFDFAGRVAVRADSSFVSKRRVNARRWRISATENDRPTRAGTIAARQISNERMISLKPEALAATQVRPFRKPSPTALQRLTDLCEEQELWFAAKWHWRRSTAGANNVATRWQNIRLQAGAGAWRDVIAACEQEVPPELKKRPDFLRTKADAQMALSAEPAHLQECLLTLEKWRSQAPDDPVAALRVAEVQFFLKNYPGAYEILIGMIKQQEPLVWLPRKGAPESGALPSLWQRAAEHALVASRAEKHDAEVWVRRYREGSYGLLQNFGGTPDNGGIVAWPFALASQEFLSDPDVVGPKLTDALATVVTIADRAVGIDPANVFRVNTLGALLVRCGRYSEAIPWLEEARRLWNQRQQASGGTRDGSLEPRGELGRPMDWVFLAMAHDGIANGKDASPNKKEVSPAEQEFHRMRADHFAKLARERKHWARSSGGGNVWRDELTRRELEVLTSELGQIPLQPVEPTCQEAVAPVGLGTQGAPSGEVTPTVNR